MKLQAQLTALSAPLGVKVTSTGATQSSPAVQAEKRDAEKSDPSVSRESAYDPSADKDKEAFFARAERDESWILPHGRMAGQTLEVKTGAVIPAVMVTGINSDLPGNIIAQVSQNVWDTASGRHYDSRVVYGQERVLVAWNRLVFPDGSAFTLGAMPGSDMAGYAGYTDEVNNHYLRIFGSSVLMSLISGGTAYTMDSLSGNSNNSTNNTPTCSRKWDQPWPLNLGRLPRNCSRRTST